MCVCVCEYLSYIQKIFLNSTIYRRVALTFLSVLTVLEIQPVQHFVSGGALVEKLTVSSGFLCILQLKTNKTKKTQVMEKWNYI